MVLCSTQHLVGVVVCGGRILGNRGLRADIDVVAVGELATSALSSSCSSEADVRVANRIENTTIAIIIVACCGVANWGLAEGDASLENWALHVINEDSEVTWLAVPELASRTGVRSGVLGRSVCVLTVTTRDDVISVNRTTDLEVGPVVHAILVDTIDEVRPVLDLHGVVLTVSQVGDGWSGSKVLVESVVRLHGSCVRGKDGNVVVIVANELGGINPPAADTLLGVVELKVVPCVELDG